MRYYFVDQDRKEKILDVMDTQVSGGVRVFQVNQDGKTIKFQARELAGKIFGSWDGKSWFKLPKLSVGEALVSNATTYKVYRGFKPSGLFDAGAGALITQMPGKVVKVFVKAGDKVQAGQTIVILEAMKMENEIKAAVTGIVKTINVQPGQALEAGLVLADIEEEA